MTRESGYYWVKMKDFGECQPAEWYNGSWWIIGSEIWFEESEILEVGEKIIKKR